MCGIPPSMMDPVRARDYYRGRFAHPERFEKIKRYAQQRWDRTKNLRHSRRWYGIIESVDSRKPR